EVGSKAFKQADARLVAAMAAEGRRVFGEPSRAEPSRADPSRAEPSRAEPSRAEGCVVGSEPSIPAVHEPRPVKAVSLQGMSPGMDGAVPPVFDWVDPGRLPVDHAYQRNLSERSLRLI